MRVAVSHGCVRGLHKIVVPALASFSAIVRMKIGW